MMNKSISILPCLMAFFAMVHVAPADDNVILQGIQGTDTSFGWVGFAFAANAADVKLLQVDDGESGGVDATPETIASNEYPVSRPLFFYVKKAHVGVIPGIQEYLNEFSSDKAWGEDGYLAEKGMIPMPNSERTKFRSDIANLQILMSLK